MLTKKRFVVLIFSLLSILTVSFQPAISVMALSDFPLVFLSDYKTDLKIGDSFYLVAITTTGKKATFSSSDSKIASVNTYGKITAKKSGTALITAKIKDAEASCKITVLPTTIILNRRSLSIENNTTVSLSASSSTNTPLKWKSSKSSIATVNEKGLITAKKPGETTITVSADGTSNTCVITVNKPTITLNKSNVNLYRKNTAQLSATVSSGLTPKWKSNRSSIATINENGLITAIKHGTAIITATVDGVSKTCEVVVNQPEITLSETTRSLKTGERFTLKAKVSSGNTPTWTTSNINKATVSESGVVTAKEKGKVYVYASEDGVKSRCTVTITDK